ncbi:MAG: hypothetical protein KGZ89_01065 [Actinobacteria bacterium]|nr:hypothetical protein [Actinomycetota bacterium]
MDSKISAADLLSEATRRRDIHLSLLVADTGLWEAAAYTCPCCAWHSG